MYPATLSRTSVEILAFLASHVRKAYTIRQLSKGIGKDYKITYDMTKRLAAQGILTIERRANLLICRLNVRNNAQFLSFIESLRLEHFLKRNPELRLIASELLSKIDLPFFTAMLFGSHVKGTATKKSDLDILFTVPYRQAEKTVSNAVASLERTMPVGIHEVILTNDEFSQLLSENKPNVAREAIEDHIILYGAEAFYKLLGEIA